MERFFKKKLITAIMFVLFLFIFPIANFINTYKKIKEEFSKDREKAYTVRSEIKNIEGAINENILKKYAFIEFYGYLQKLMIKNEQNNFEVIKDNNGVLQYTYFATGPNKVDILAYNTEKLKKSLKSKDTKFICVIPPDKFVTGYTTLPKGIPYNYNNETADNYIYELNKRNIDTLDLRKSFEENKVNKSEMFFKTDHHWTIQTSFLAFQNIIEMLNCKYNMNLDENRFYTDNKNYNFIEYKNSYLGSIGRKAGISYSGIDDFTLIYPKFKTFYEMECKAEYNDFFLSGRFEEALINAYPFTNEKGIYALESDKYFSYLFGNTSTIHIKNKKVKNGKKMLFIKDSFAVPVAGFMSTLAEDIYLVDPRYYKGSIEEYVNSIKELDIVFILYSLPDLTEEFFNFE